MKNYMFNPVALAFGAALGAATALPVAAAAQSEAAEVAIEEVFVLGKRRAYQGNFDDLESPASNQIISEELLRQAGVINLDDALDLAGSVARQNNFGGL